MDKLVTIEKGVDPGLIPYAYDNFLPVLLKVKGSIERATGFKWRMTSWIRCSYSHKNGSALDIAPLIDSNSIGDYAFSKGSDPILSRRIELAQKIVSIPNLRYSIPFSKQYRVGIFIETDHIHIGLFKQDGKKDVVHTWPNLKSYYGDTAKRNRLRYIRNTPLFPPPVQK